MAPTSAGAVPDDIVVMGQVLLPYGVKGWLRIRPHTESPDGLLQFKAWWLRAPGGCGSTGARIIEKRGGGAQAAPPGSAGCASTS